MIVPLFVLLVGLLQAGGTCSVGATYSDCCSDVTSTECRAYCLSYSYTDSACICYDSYVQIASGGTYYSSACCPSGSRDQYGSACLSFCATATGYDKMYCENATCVAGDSYAACCPTSFNTPSCVDFCSGNLPDGSPSAADPECGYQPVCYASPCYATCCPTDDINVKVCGGFGGLRGYCTYSGVYNINGYPYGNSGGFDQHGTTTGTPTYEFLDYGCKKLVCASGRGDLFASFSHCCDDTNGEPCDLFCKSSAGLLDSDCSSCTACDCLASASCTVAPPPLPPYTPPSLDNEEEDEEEGEEEEEEGEEEEEEGEEEEEDEGGQGPGVLTVCSVLGEAACKANPDCDWSTSAGCAAKSSNSSGTNYTIIIIIIVVVVVVLIVVLVIVLLLLRKNKKLCFKEAEGEGEGEWEGESKGKGTSSTQELDPVGTANTDANTNAATAAATEVRAEPEVDTAEETNPDANAKASSPPEDQAGNEGL